MKNKVGYCEKKLIFLRILHVIWPINFKSKWKTLFVGKYKFHNYIIPMS